MRCLLTCLSLFLGLSLLVPRPALCQSSDAAPAPLSEADGYRFAFQYDPPRIPYIIIQVSINGRPPLPFMLDTGTNTPVIIDTEAAKILGLKASGVTDTANKGRFSFGDTPAVRSVLLRGTTAGRDIEFKGDGAVIADLAPVKERFPWVNLAGILGVNLLDRFTVRLDFSRKVLTLYVKSHPPILTPGSAAVPLIAGKNKHRWFVPVSSSPGLRAVLIVDTGSPTTSLPLATTSRVRVAPRFGDGSFMLGTYYISQTLLLPSVKIGASSLNNVAVGASPIFAGCTLGNDLLACFRVTLDFPHHQMFLERAADRPYHLNGWGGFTLKPEGSDFRVKEVVAGSPAEVAGLRVGDRVLSIDGHALHGLPPAAATKLRSGFAGTRATLLLQRDKLGPITLSFVRVSEFAAPPDLMTGLTVEEPDKRPISVIQVDAGSPAEKAGLMAGDTITAVDGVPSIDMSADQTDEAFGKDTLTLTVQRAGESKPRVAILAK